MPQCKTWQSFDFVSMSEQGDCNNFRIARQRLLIQVRKVRNELANWFRHSFFEPRKEANHMFAPKASRRPSQSFTTNSREFHGMSAGPRVNSTPLAAYSAYSASASST